MALLSDVHANVQKTDGREPAWNHGVKGHPQYHSGRPKLRGDSANREKSLGRRKVDGQLGWVALESICSKIA